MNRRLHFRATRSALQAKSHFGLRRGLKHIVGGQTLSPSVIPVQGAEAVKGGEPGRANVGDLGPVARGDAFEQVKAMEEVQFQQLRVRTFSSPASFAFGQ